MRVFEFHFRPKEKKDDFVFDSFCFEPDKAYEKRLGSLFLVGELKNALPQNLKFLDNFASFFKKQYYSSPMKLSPESSLKYGLKKANVFLDGISKTGDVSWLGNLNLAVLSIKNFELNMTKVGEIKVLLLRQGQITDVGKNLELEGIEPYPLKIFSNIVSGKLAQGDVILVLTSEVFNFLTSRNLLKKISHLPGLDEKKLTAVLQTRQSELSKISGVCLTIVLTKAGEPGADKSGVFTFGERTEKFSLRDPFSPFVAFFKKARLYFSRDFLRFKGLEKRFRKLKKKVDSATRIKRKKFTLPFLNIKFRLPKTLNRNIILVSSLILFLIIGFFIFKVQEQNQLKKNQAILAEAQDNISRAESYLALNNEKDAFALYKKVWQTVLPLSEKSSPIQAQALSLKDNTQTQLEKISNLEKVQDPKLIFEFDEKEFIPQKIVYFQNNLYLFSPVAANVYRISLSGEKKVLATEQAFSEAAAFTSQILFFQKPNLLFFLKNDNFGSPLSLSLPYSDFELKNLSVYRGNLYLLDSKKGEITKYEDPLAQNKDFPQAWLSQQEEKLTNAESMAVDGPIWILNKNNTISQYYLGKFKETIIPDFFPWPENLSSISTLYDLIYILEPSQKRIAVITKSNNVIKQFQSDKFDNLKDFAVSDNGRTIWLLNGTKIYQVKW